MITDIFTDLWKNIFGTNVVVDADPVQTVPQTVIEALFNLRAVRWDDAQGDISQGTANTALTYEVFRDTPFKFYHWRSGQADELHMRYQMPHGWDPKTTVRPHLHIIPLADPPSPQTFAVSGYYVWAKYGKKLPVLSGWTPFTASHVVNPTTDIDVPTIVSLGEIPPDADCKESDILLIYMRRAVADTYTQGKTGGTSAANVALTSADAHVQKVKPGTITEFPAVQV